MLPTLHNGDYWLINKATYVFGRPQRGDIIVFEAPGEIPRDFVKQIVAVEGETIEIKPDTTGQSGLDHDCGDCGVYVNGVKLNEPYIKKQADYTVEPTTVPPGHVYVLGDNRRNSSDSHVWGPLLIQNIIGKLLFRYAHED